MKIGILGSGDVGIELARGFISSGHEVWLATREPGSEKAGQLQADLPPAHIVDFATAAAEAELAVFCVNWTAAEEAIKMIGPDNLAGKIVIDTSNVIQMEGDTMVYGGDAVAAAIKVQQWLPDSKVVKAFNTVGAAMMYMPKLPAKPTMFMAGDDTTAKNEVKLVIEMFGWEALDTGPLSTARDLESMALVWIRNSAHNGREHAFKML
jgi:predicted dinucleotide-binding enzyme